MMPPKRPCPAMMTLPVSSISSASRFVDFLQRAGMSYWQMLPLVPVMDEFSPYQSTSAMAGNPLSISPELLLEEGLIGQERLEGLPDFPEERVDVSMVLSWAGFAESSMAEFYT